MPLNPAHMTRSNSALRTPERADQGTSQSLLRSAPCTNQSLEIVAMSSDNRASSAVRNLRSLFENKGPESNTSDARGRSPNGVGSDKENGHRPKSKIRASFVAVEPVTSMSTTRTERRGSFGEADGDLALRKTISEQQGQLNVPEAAMESVSPSAVGTPTRTEGPNLGHVFNFPKQSRGRAA